jgi:cytochrome d ubiquinol oxidase subunit I
MVMLFIGLFGAVLVWRRNVETQRWFLRLCIAAGPAGFIAVIAGWFTAEIGRQPYTVYGLLRTVDSVSPVTAGAVGTSLIVFIFAYSIVFAAGMYYILKLAKRGPEGPAHPPSAKPDEPVLGVPLALGREDSAEAAG